MEKKLIIRLTLAVTVSVFLYACSTKKQTVSDARTSIAFESLTPKGIDTFHLRLQMPPMNPLPKIFTAQEDYETAYRELEAMLSGTIPPDFERAVFVSENPYHYNQYSYEGFQKTISLHLYSVRALMAANDKSDSMNFSATVNEHGRFKLDNIRHLPSEKKELYRKALSNWAVFTYMTDTTEVYPFLHLPLTYAGHDPFGMKDWSSSQVIGLLLSDKQQGNCFALTAFYKIMADRLNSGARLCTAPQHIYIQHQDPKGDYYNVELATAGHPTDGTIQTLTHTTSTAIRSGVALRSYDDKQSIGLCLVNLAKSYEHRFNTKSHVFLLRCAELALAHDSLNLNALLLKQQVLDEQVTEYARRNSAYGIPPLKKQPKIWQTMKALETHLALLYRLGYREMPVDMQKIIMTGIYPKTLTDKNPSPFTTIDPKDPHRKEFQSSYGGLFQEVFGQKEIETYGHYSFSTKNNEVVHLDTSTKNTLLIDPVAFAYDFGARMYDARLGRWLSTDPLQAKYPDISPYTFVGNSPLLFKDPDGRVLIVAGSAEDWTRFKAVLEVQFANAVIFTRDANTNVVTMAFNDAEIAKMAKEQNTTAEAIKQKLMNNDAVYMLFSDITNPDPAKGTTNIEVRDNIKGATIGHFGSDLQQIDIGDVEALDKVPGLKSTAALIHEIAEAYTQQVLNNKDDVFATSHGNALTYDAIIYNVNEVINERNTEDAGRPSGYISIIKITYEAKKGKYYEYRQETQIEFDLGDIEIDPRRRPEEQYTISPTTQKEITKEQYEQKTAPKTK